MTTADGYILRIATQEWVNQVFELAIYYTSARRPWRSGQYVLFLHKTSSGDAFVGYGEVGNVLAFDELSEEEKRLCERWGWKKAIELKYVVKFEKPLLLKKTFLGELKLRGKSLHGFPLNKNQIASIINQAGQTV